jgi:hypothetical protein
MIVEHFARYADGCRRMGSELYHRLLTAAGHDLAGGGAVAEAVAGWEDSAFDDAVPLRLMGGVHRLVLTGAAPALASHYPSAGGTPRPDAEEVFTDAIAANIVRLAAEMGHPPQTNEVNRCGLLLAGFLAVARRLGPEIRILEIGSSAGLNQLFDRYHYDLAVGSWGDPSPVEIVTEWRGVDAVPTTPVTVASRRGCDTMPLAVTDPEAMLRLRSFIWADQVDRLARLDAAIALGRHDPPPIDEALGQDWLEGRLAMPGPPPVVVHSFVFQYLEREAREAVTAAYDTLRGPKARISVEGGLHEYEIEVHVWPDEASVVLGTGNAHGAWLELTSEGRMALG